MTNRNIIANLVAALAAIALPLSLRADTEVVNGIEWTYTVSDGKASVGSDYSYSAAIPTSTSGAITIPYHARRLSRDEHRGLGVPRLQRPDVRDDW